MNINSLFPNCPVRVVFSDLQARDEAGNYCAVKDVITLCTRIKRDLPICRDIVYLHEMFHATGHRTRSLRRARLVQNFGVQAARVEECIAEICTMVALKKLGMLNKYSAVIPQAGLAKYYDRDIYIPWREVVAALNYFKDDEVDFTKEQKEIRKYLETEFKIRIEETYEGIGNRTN